MQKDTRRIDEIEQQMTEHMREQNIKNGTLDNENSKKKYSHKVKKGDDYVM